MASYLINAIPNIKSKKYLELGVWTKTTFDAVASAFKRCVDILKPADYQMSTDLFFQQQDVPTFDIVYIDADHSIHSLIKDFNNVQSILNPHPYIFVHDLYPDTKELTASHYCGDSYKFLAYIIDNSVMTGDFMTLDSDYGLSVFRNPVKVDIPAKYLSLSYEAFLDIVKPFKRYSTKQIQNNLALSYGATW